ncbi:MAG: ABC transporter substrate-binding protein [Pseudomonadota bacterium]
MADKFQESSGTSLSENSPFEQLTGAEREPITSALKRGASRRQVMSLLMASGATVAMAGSLVGGAERVLAMTPKKGGSLRAAVSLHGPKDTLDPISSEGSIDYMRSRAHYNNLVQLNDDMSPRAELAEEFEANKDASEWTFVLRKGVKWHDGSPFTADDVLYSLKRHLGKDTKSVVKALVSNVKEVKKVGPLEVKIIMETPNADLSRILGTFHFRMVKDGESNFQNPQGTGPYRLQEFKPGVRSVHVRNEDYWRETANIEKLELFAITDAVARVNALKAGDVQLINNLDPKAIKQLDGTGNSVWSVPSGAYTGIVMMTDKAPGNNPDFREAIKYLQRRDRFVKTILGGHGTAGNDHPINAAYGADHCETLPMRPYDPDKAKFHLKKSGVTSVTMEVAEVAHGITDICLFLQREAAKIGLNINVKKVPNDGYWGAIWQKTPMHTTAWNMRPTANTMIGIAFAPDAPWNDSYWKDERLGKLLVESRSVTDPAKRKEMYCEMQSIISNNSGMCIPVHTNYVDGVSDKVKGLGKLPLEAFGGMEFPEFAWLDS